MSIDTDPRLDAPGSGLDVQLARLDAVVAELSAPPIDRDPVLWAAHEFARCAQLLITARTPEDGAATTDLGPALDHARSAMLSLTMARRDAAR